MLENNQEAMIRDCCLYREKSSNLLMRANIIIFIMIWRNLLIY